MSKVKKFPPCHCRLCKEVIDRNTEVEGVDWIMPKKNQFYHKSCYESWRAASPTEDEEWVEYIYDFISRDLKVKYDYFMCEAQRKKFLKENKMTNKGIFFTLKYFYELKHGDWDKGHGGLGIVPYVYNEACNYWILKERESKGIVAQIERQMQEAKDRESRIVRKKKAKENKSFMANLKAIGEMEDE